MPRVDAIRYMDPALAAYTPPGTWQHLYAAPLMARSSGPQMSVNGRDGFRGIPTALGNVSWLPSWLPGNKPSSGPAQPGARSWDQFVRAEAGNLQTLQMAIQIGGRPGDANLLAGVNQFFAGNIAVGNGLAGALQNAMAGRDTPTANAFQVVANSVNTALTGLLSGSIQPPPGIDPAAAQATAAAASSPTIFGMPLTTVALGAVGLGALWFLTKGKKS